ncbi:MAG: AlkA N-terminal domain-containing protein [Candidatus Krumholzibacteriia bacterium]
MRTARRYNSSMELDPKACYRALRARDARFDGRFFTGVVSTGVYCRPVCPAPTPKRQNCRFFPCAAAAQEAGFRPCLRCHPETSPGTPAWRGTTSTVARALRLISEGGLDDSRVDDLSERLGVGERHLRRLFQRQLGTSPGTVARTRRVLFAKKLIDETQLPMAEVAMSAGFASVRRFNDAIRATFERTPTELRRVRAAARNGARRPSVPSTSDIELKLGFRPPLQWEALLRFLERRATPGVASTGTDSYRRTVSIDGHQGVIEVRRVAGESCHLLARIRLANPTALIQVVERLRRKFDLDADPQEIAAHLRSDRRLAPLLAALPGLRIPGAWDSFEIAVRAILGQQVSVRAATTLAARLVEAHGERLALDGPPDLWAVFPRPEVLAAADLTRIGMPRARAAAIASLAAAVADGKLKLDAARPLDDTIRRLCELPGIGEWTAQYVAMRALGEPDAFPAADLGLRHALGTRARPVTATEVARAAEPWRPWRAYAAMYLWTGG